MLKIKKFFFNPFRECCSLAWDDSGKEGAIIDPGFYTPDERDELFRFIKENGIKPLCILLTHGHFDHIFGVKECIVEFGIPVYMDPADKIILQNDHIFTKACKLKTPDTKFETEDLHEGDVIGIGKIQFKVIQTPGHTPGGVSFLDEKDKTLFSGDTLFAGSIGRTDNAWGDYDKLIKSVLDKLMGLDGDTRVIPGHGPETTISKEIADNSFLIPFNEPNDELQDTEGLELNGKDD
jgi:glyoxylase-like metal-dependent hydrolase (beta-lactamase superfamily II)